MAVKNNALNIARGSAELVLGTALLGKRGLEISDVVTDQNLTKKEKTKQIFKKAAFTTFVASFVIVDGIFTLIASRK